eukprot:Gb_07564 [translate_table: standard]
MQKQLSKSNASRLDASLQLQIEWPQPLHITRLSSPPSYPDICGRHRKQVELNRLTKEISMLEEELKLLEGLPLASKCCKEVVEVVDTRPDPLLPFVARGQAPSSWDRWFRERSVDSNCSCYFCRHFKLRRFPCWKITCRQASCIFPKLFCYKCSCFRCVKCCSLCRKK